MVDEVLGGLPSLPARPEHIDTEPAWRANRLNTDLWLNRMAESAWVDRGTDAPTPSSRS